MTPQTATTTVRSHKKILISLRQKQFENLCEFLCLNRAKEGKERQQRENFITWRNDGVVCRIKNYVLSLSRTPFFVFMKGYANVKNPPKHRNYEFTWSTLKIQFHSSSFSSLGGCCRTFEGHCGWRSHS